MAGLPYSYDQWMAIGDFVELPNDRLFTVRKGAGPPLVLLHSYGGNSWMFGRVIDALAGHFTVFTYDLPGCARSDTPPLPYDVPDYAEVLEQFLDSQGIESTNLIACGGSSMTAANFAATRAARVERLVLESLISYGTRAERIAWWENKFKDLIDESTLLPKDDGGIFYREKMNLYPELSDEERLQVFAVQDADREAHGRWWAEGLRGTQLRYDINHHLGSIEAETLLIYAELSWQRTEDPEFGRQMEQRVLESIADSRLVLIPETYGETFFERAETWTDIVLEFLHRAAAP